MKINKILVPFDFSECADNALKYALRITEKTGSQITLLNICLVPNPVTDNDIHFDKTTLDEVEQINRDHLNRIREKIPALEHAQIETDTFSTVSDGIKHRVESGDVDLIIMGTKGIKGFYEVLFTSNAAQIVHKTTKPVLIVPTSYQEQQIKKIALAGDYQALGNPRDTYILAEICNLFKATLEIFNVNPADTAISPEKAYEAAQLEDYFKGVSHSYHEIHQKDIETGILDYIKQHDIDLITMIPRKYTWLQQLFRPSLTKKMAQHLQIPLLVIHEM